MFNFKELNATNIVVESLHGDVTIPCAPVELGEMSKELAFLNGVAYAIILNCGLPNTPAPQGESNVTVTAETSATSEEI